jgi:hypothetical protein
MPLCYLGLHGLILGELYLYLIEIAKTTVNTKRFYYPEIFFFSNFVVSVPFTAAIFFFCSQLVGILQSEHT